ncbi:NCS1 nucleoside transporter family [Motilibacter rhizosphaerae]|uniref:NCS1 nucleoside transporter family n=1 Tax=Motilibacter rhizosphaerae TaxID=598652 RepID=A0A4Q7NXT5_9ACTN|nr:cytosine permease [Motilibacter rhizosphaerae]RZS91738.1 NCS1 nucleoside transporter family [Motilibacter rhizosphaerae]
MAVQTDPRGGSARTTGLEVRSIDYVPLSERHGEVWSQGPLWFMSNAQIATLVVGVVSTELGGNLLWSLIAVIAGSLVGTLFMAFHSAQGPQLGLPQMIQSRPQFGYVGALLVWAFAYLQYAGFNIFNTILAGQGLHATVHGPTRLWIVVASVVAVLVALVGYDLIHRTERYLAFGFLLFFGILTVVVLTLHYPAGSFDLGAFKVTPFLAQFGVVAGYQISWAIYVSDYSRYLPPDVTVRKTFYWTYGGSALGAIWIMCLGAALATWWGESHDAFDTIESLHHSGNHFFGGYGLLVVLFSTLGLIAVTALNMYGGSLTLISATDSLKPVRPTLRIRVVMVLFTAALSLVPALALLNSNKFQDYFNFFLLLVLYLFIPWTAVNLVDYYVVRRGHYAVAEIFNPNGIYGRWGWRGIGAYLAGFVAMTPFFSTTHYTGWVAHQLDGADISLFVGLPVAGILYWVLSRSIDVDSERRVAEAEAVQLEEGALHHETRG